MWLKSVPGIIVCVGIPLLLLIGYDVIRRKTYAKKHEQTEAELRAELESLKNQNAAAGNNNVSFGSATNNQNKFGSY